MFEKWSSSDSMINGHSKVHNYSNSKCEFSVWSWMGYWMK